MTKPPPEPPGPPDPIPDPLPGAVMQREIAQIPQVFAQALGQSLAHVPPLGDVRAVYTVARGSSDAAANILAYEGMRHTGLPVTSLPPSVFSLGGGVALAGALVLVISQSGASDDLVRTARGAGHSGARVLALVNAPGSAVAQAAQGVIAISAGPELAVPATKSVVGAIAGGMALLAHLRPAYGTQVQVAAGQMAGLAGQSLPGQAALVAALLRARHVYVIGRDTGFGAAQELALKLKECCALHAEAYSASEALHGPLQLATNPLLVLILDTEAAWVQDSLNLAQARFAAAGASVYRIRPSDAGTGAMPAAAAAAALLYLTYPLALQAALALGLNPDHPATLTKVTQTR